MRAAFVYRREHQEGEKDRLKRKEIPIGKDQITLDSEEKQLTYASHI
jgi:hypothetical protein